MASDLSLHTIPSKGGQGSGAGRNARWLNIGEIAILFSYRTPVAFQRGAICARREHISKTTSDQLSSVGADAWPIKEHDKFAQELEAQLFAEINGWPEDVMARSSALVDIISKAMDELEGLRNANMNQMSLRQEIETIRLRMFTRLMSADLRKGPIPEPR